MSLRWRWALTLGSVAAVAIGFSIALTLALTAGQLRGEVDRDLTSRAERIGNDPVATLSRLTRPNGLQPQVADLDAVVRVFDSEGRLLAATTNDPGLPTGSSLMVESAKPISVVHDHRVFRVITLSLQRGFLQIAVDITRDIRSIRTLVRRLVPIGVTGTLAAALIGWFLADRATRPIIALSSAAEEIARTERLEADFDTSAPGEVGTLSRSFVSMVAALSKSRTQQQRLVSDASHELRTPLTALQTNLETLDRSFDRLSGDQRNELIKAAVAEVHELADLSAELVALATDVRHSEEPLEDVDLCELATEVSDRFSRREGREIEVRCLDGASVGARRSQLDRALANLLANAVKWSPTSPVRTVVVGRCITVEDSGPGIPEVSLPHVFERFYRADAARTLPGSGLGLAIVEHIVEAHGGRVFARNRPEGGAAVGFEL